MLVGILLLIGTSSTLASAKHGHTSLQLLLQDPLPAVADLNPPTVANSAAQEMPLVPVNAATSFSKPVDSVLVHNVVPSPAHGPLTQSPSTATVTEVSATSSGTNTITSDDGTKVEAGGVTTPAVISASDADAAHVDIVTGVPVPPTKIKDPIGKGVEGTVVEDQAGRANVAPSTLPLPTSKFFFRWRCPPGYAKCGLLCWPCRAGYYSSGLIRSCLPCPVGTMSAAKSSMCTRCSRALGPGYTTTSAGRAVCDKCLPGYAGKSCTPCGYGKYSRGGFRSSKLVCHSCPTGYTTKTRTAANKLACVAGEGEFWEVSTWGSMESSNWRVDSPGGWGGGLGWGSAGGREGGWVPVGHRVYIYLQC